MKQETNYEALIFSNINAEKNQPNKENCTACKKDCPLKSSGKSLQLNIFFKLLTSFNKDLLIESTDDPVKIIPAKNFIHFSVGLFHDRDGFSDLNPHFFLIKTNFN